MCRAVEQLVRDERVEERLDMIRVMMKNLGLTFEQAMKSAEIPESDWLEYKKLLEEMGK